MHPFEITDVNDLMAWYVRNLLVIKPVQALQKFAHIFETWNTLLVSLFLAKLNVYTNKVQKQLLIKVIPREKAFSV